MRATDAGAVVRKPSQTDLGMFAGRKAPMTEAARPVRSTELGVVLSPLAAAKQVPSAGTISILKITGASGAGLHAAEWLDSEREAIMKARWNSLLAVTLAAAAGTPAV